MDPKYYKSPNINAYPSSNSVDTGKLMLEENITELTTKLTLRNFCYTSEDYKLTLLDNSQVQIGPGNCNILGYGIHTTTENLILDKPDSTIEVGKAYVCLRLAYDSSNHILGDVGIEGGTKYFNGVYALWMMESQFTDDTLVLGSADWDGTNITNLEENPDKEMIFDIDKILVFPGINLQDFLNGISRKYVHRDGDKAVEIDLLTGEDVYNGTGGDIYGNIFFKTGREDTGENDYGIKLGVENKQQSIIEVKPFSEYAREFKTIIGSSNVRSYIQLGMSEIAYVNSADTLSIEGCPVLIGDETTIDNTLTVRTSANRYDFQPENFTSLNSFGKIIQGHQTIEDVNSSYIQFEDTSNAQYYANILYNYSTHTLNIGGSNSSISFNLPVSFDDIIVRDNHKIIFEPRSNNTYIKGEELRLGDVNKYIEYLSGSFKVVSNQSTSIKVEDSVNHSYSEMFNSGLITLQSRNSSSAAAGIKFQGNGSSTSVLLSNQYNTKILKLTGNFVVDGDVSTVNGGRVFNAVYNDYAENYYKDNVMEIVEPGDIICVDDKTQKYRKVREISDLKLVVGVCSDTYGFLLGGDENMSKEQMALEYIPVGVSGRVYVKTDDQDILPGNLLKSDVNAKAVRAYASCDRGCIIGKALESPKNGKVYMQIMLG